MSLRSRIVGPILLVIVLASSSGAASSDAVTQRRRGATPPPAVRSSSGWSLTLGPEVQVKIGQLLNAPNGHISYRMSGSQLTLWVDGRLPDKSQQTTQGTFILHPKSWDPRDLESASPIKVFEAPHNRDACDAKDGFYRDYAAINAVIPGVKPGELLAFVDGEFHPDKYSTDPAKSQKPSIPLLAGIGLATSTDGLEWTMQGPIVQGLDMASYRNGDGVAGCRAVVSTMARKTDLEGAAGPSAIVRTDGDVRYIYVYYEDRVRLTSVGGAEPARSGSVGARGRGRTLVRVTPTAYLYVARSPYGRDGAPGTWQYWTGSGWGAPQSAAPILKAPDGGEAAHPQVSFNTALNRWLMVFHAKADLYAATSSDGVAWDSPLALKATNARTKTPSFPTLISPEQPDQQTTSATGALYYSAHATGSYLGFTRTFTVSAGTSVGARAK